MFFRCKTTIQMFNGLQSNNNLTNSIIRGYDAKPSSNSFVRKRRRRRNGCLWYPLQNLTTTLCCWALQRVYKLFYVYCITTCVHYFFKGKKRYSTIISNIVLTSYLKTNTCHCRLAAYLQYACQTSFFLAQWLSNNSSNICNLETGNYSRARCQVFMTWSILLRYTNNNLFYK